MAIDYREEFRIKIKDKNINLKKEVVKLLLTIKLLNKYRKQKHFIRIRTEFEIDDLLTCDIYFENTRIKQARIYEIRDDYSKEWLRERKIKYKDWEVPFMEYSYWIPIKLDSLSNNIEKLNEQLEEFV